MANPDSATGTCEDHGLSELLPLSPYSALSYHFGMLLGVDDFETEQAYHRAKHRLHNAWLHREGVVWGFGVEIDKDQGEIKVAPGLALDAAGHELHLDAAVCLDVEKWLEKNKDDPDLELETTDNEKKIKHAHVVIRFKACLTRQVPAFLEPCNNAGTGTAYSRIFETVEVLMLPGTARVKDPPYHRLRLLFGVEPAETGEDDITTPGDQEVLDALAEIQALPEDERPAALMAAFHRFAALDEIDLQPAKSEDDARTLLFPGRDDEPVVLANITDLTLTKQNGGWVVSGGEVDSSVRPSHVATTTIQDLLCGPVFGASETPAPEELGPQVDPESVTFPVDDQIEFNVSEDLHQGSVTADAFSVAWFDTTSGWKPMTITASYDSATRKVTLTAADKLGGRVRVIAKGTGPTPLLGIDLVPLAGAVGGPAGTTHDGHDFVHMQDFVVEPPPEPEPDENEEPSSDAKAAKESGTSSKKARSRRGKPA